MIAAIYARKSNEQPGSGDKSESVERQLTHARAYAAKKGWTVAAEHEYSDDGISGAVFGDGRPGLARLLNALSRNGGRPPFQAVIASEESRFGRKRVETEWNLHLIVEAGVRVFFYLDDREAKLDDATGSMLEAFRLYASQMERERTSQRTRDAMQRRAAQGHIAGGNVYGYRREGGDERLDTAQAQVIRRVFAEIAEGRGLHTVAQRLNADAVPSPRPGGRWSTSGVRAIVFRELYRGRLRWGTTRWTVRGGRRIKQARPESEWVTREAPALRIVDEDLWRAAHDRLDRTRQTYLRATGGRLFGRPESGIESKYLLVGFVTCQACDGGMHVAKRWGKTLCYFCTTHRQRGAAACGNVLGAPLDGPGGLHADLADRLERDLLAADVVEAALARAQAIWTNGDDAAAERERLEREAARLEAEIVRGTEAIFAAGGPVASLGAGVKARERRLGAVRADLRALCDGGGGVASEDVLPELRELLGGWRDLLCQETAHARQLLRKVLTTRVVLAPQLRPDGRFYAWSVQASYGRLLSGLISCKGLRATNLLRSARWTGFRTGPRQPRARGDG
jgi:DNA invertase Pin-like site-specific DNA recombinase